MPTTRSSSCPPASSSKNTASTRRPSASFSMAGGTWKGGASSRVPELPGARNQPVRHPPRVVGVAGQIRLQERVLEEHPPEDQTRIEHGQPESKPRPEREPAAGDRDDHSQISR